MSGWTRSRSSCSTRPTACWTWASSATIRKIVASCPTSARRCCSRPPCPARSPSSAADLLQDPVRVEVTPAATTVERIEQRVLFVDSANKRGAAGRTAQGPGDEPRPRLHPHQARRRPGGRSICRACGSTPPPIHGNKSPERAPARAGELPHRPTSGCWWPPTSPPAASTSTASPMSSISTCRTCRKAMSTASAAPRGPAPRASRSRFCSRRRAPLLRDIEKLTRPQAGGGRGPSLCPHRGGASPRRGAASGAAAAAAPARPGARTLRRPAASRATPRRRSAPRVGALIRL